MREDYHLDYAQRMQFWSAAMPFWRKHGRVPLQKHRDEFDAFMKGETHKMTHELFRKADLFWKRHIQFHFPGLPSRFLERHGYESGMCDVRGVADLMSFKKS